MRKHIKKIQSMVKHPEYEKYNGAEELVKFQRMMAKDYPYYPIEEKDWGKMNEFVITIKGLEQLHILKRESIRGSCTPEDITLFIQLLELHATTNVSIERLRDHTKYLNFHIEDLMKTRYLPDLVKEGLAMANDDYNPILSQVRMVWGTELIQECHKRNKQERYDELL